VSRAPAENVVFKKVPYEHWRVNPEFDELEFRIITEGSARLASLLAEEVHIADVPAELLSRAEEGGMAIIESATPGRRVAINFLGAYLADPANNDTWLYPDSPMTDRRFRRALAKAIDTDTLNEAFFGGKGEPIHSWYWIPELPGWNPEWDARFEEEYGYDPEVSLALLEELRAEGTFGTDFTVEMLATEGRGGPETADVIEAVAGMLTDVGINAPITTIDIIEHRDKQRSLGFSCAIEMDDSASENITGARPKIYALHTSRGSAVESFDVIPLWEAVRDTMDPEVQTAAWAVLGDAIFDLIPHKPLIRLAQSLAVNPAVVSGYTFPGAMLSVPYSHYEYIEKA
jgi:ABC-type transport system substrate-binding protein